MSGTPDTPSRKRITNLEPVRRLCLTPEEAAASIGCSRAFWDEHILPDLRVIRKGKLVLVPVIELERYIQREAALTLKR